MNPRAMLALRWIRTAVTEWDRAYAAGFINALNPELDEWERGYLNLMVCRKIQGLPI